MTAVHKLKTETSVDTVEWQVRVDLAAALRLAVEFNWHEGVANHFSAAISEDGKKFLLNPRWRHWADIKASDLLLLDSNDEDTMNRPNAPDPSAWCIHGSIHAEQPRARVLLHVHPTYATALAGLADPEMKPIEQNTARFYNRVSVDRGFGGIADEKAEGLRLAHALGNHATMVMGNHGILISAQTVAEAFDALYYYERAAQTMVLAYSTGKPLAVLSHDIAEKTAAAWETYGPMAVAHFEELKRMLDKKDPSYKE